MQHGAAVFYGLLATFTAFIAWQAMPLNISLDKQ